MNILIDFSQIPKKKGGVGVYAQNLARQLSLQDKRNTYYIMIQDDDDCLDDIEGTNFRFFRLNHKIFRLFLFRFIFEQFFIPVLIKRMKIDIIHSLHYSFPIISFQASVIVTVHDMTFFLFPKYHLLFKKYYFRFFIKQVARRASAIIAVSKSTKHDFLRLTGISSNKIKVIPLGRPPEAVRSSAFATDPKSVFSKLGIKKPYILYVGTLEPRKNIKRLINAFKSLIIECPNRQLVIAGAKGWHYQKIYETISCDQVQHKVIFTGFVSDMEKYCLMIHSEVFVYPSLYEGFGLPVLEAMAFGVPTITSDRSAMPEVVGNAALMINPEDNEQLIEGVRRLIEDKVLNKGLRKRALVRSKRFRWRHTARKTLCLYQDVKIGRTLG